MDAPTKARIDTAAIARGTRFSFEGQIPRTPRPMDITTPGQTIRTEAVGIFDDYDPRRDDLLGLRCRTVDDELVCWFRREADDFLVVRVDRRDASNRRQFHARSADG